MNTTTNCLNFSSSCYNQSVTYGRRFLEDFNISYDEGFIEEIGEGCRIFEILVSVVLYGIFCLFGSVGNILSITILRRDPRHSVTLFLLTCLAVVDFLFVLPMVLLVVIPGVCRFVCECPHRLRVAVVYSNQYGWAVASMAHTGTIYTTLLVTIHRYISVCHPHKAGQLSTLFLAKVQVTIVAVFAVIYNIPRFLDFTVIQFKNGNKEIAKRTLSDFAKKVSYQIIYKNVCFCLFMYIIPLAILSVLTFKLAQTLRNRQRYRNRVVQRVSRENNTTFVLIIIVVIFIVCQTPTLFQRVFYSIFHDKGRKCGHFFFYYEHIADFLAVFNSCVNFLIYVIFAKGFRKTLRDTFCGKKSKSQLTDKHSRASLTTFRYSRQWLTWTDAYFQNMCILILLLRL